MKKETAESYRRARRDAMQTVAWGQPLAGYQTKNLQQAAVALADEVIVDLAVRAARRKRRKARRRTS